MNGNIGDIFFVYHPVSLLYKTLKMPPANCWSVFSTQELLLLTPLLTSSVCVLVRLNVNRNRNRNRSSEQINILVTYFTQRSVSSDQQKHRRGWPVSSIILIYPYLSRMLFATCYLLLPFATCYMLLSIVKLHSN